MATTPVSMSSIVTNVTTSSSSFGTQRLTTSLFGGITTTTATTTPVSTSGIALNVTSSSSSFGTKRLTTSLFGGITATTATTTPGISPLKFRTVGSENPFNASFDLTTNQHSFPRIGKVLQIEAIFEWEVQKCPKVLCSTLYKSKARILYSPMFLYSDCLWHLQLDGSGWISLHSNNEHSKSSHPKSMAYAFGIRKPDGTLEETAAEKSASEGDHSVFARANLWKQIKSLVHKRPCRSTLVVTCRMKDGNLQEVNELKTLSSNFGDLLKGKTCNDVTIKAKNKEFQAHRAILAARSPVFASMFEHNLSERETGVVDIEDSDPESFGDFLQYLYTGRIKDISFRNAYHLYVTAHKYDVKELKPFCLSCIRQNLTVKNVCDVVTLADQYDEDSLMDSAHAFFNENAGGIFETVEWETFMRKNCRLANRLLKRMVSKSIVTFEGYLDHEYDCPWN